MPEFDGMPCLRGADRAAGGATLEGELRQAHTTPSDPSAGSHHSWRPGNRRDAAKGRIGSELGQ
jgi:hypothetical protein